MTRSFLSYFIVLSMTVGFPKVGLANAPGGGDAAMAECMKKAGRDEAKKKKCREQGGANGEQQAAGEKTGGDMSPLIGALMGAALGGLMGAMAAKKALEGAEKKAAEAEARIKAELDKKFAEAEKKQKEQLDKLQNNGGPPKLGPAGVSSQIEAALAGGDIETVKKIIEANRASLPESYIQEIERRIGAVVAGNGSGTGTGGTNTGNGTVVVNPVKGPAAVMADFDRMPAGNAKNAAILNLAVSSDMVDQTRDLILEMIARGQVQAAAQQISKLEVSTNAQMVQLAQELRGHLDRKLEQMGLPSGDLGLALLTN